MSDGNEGEEECEGGKGDGDVGDVDVNGDCNVGGG